MKNFRGEGYLYLFIFEQIKVIKSSRSNGGDGIATSVPNSNLVVGEKVKDFFNAIRVQYGQLTKAVGYDGCGIQNRQRPDPRLDCR